MTTTDNSAPAAHILTSVATLLPIADLVEHPDNPREGDIGAIVESIEQNGFFGVVLVQRSSGYIIAGNHRTRAAGMLGITHVPVHVVDIDDAHALRILLADNRINDRASYDNAKLLETLQGLPSLAGTGYDPTDVDELMKLVSGEWGRDVHAKADVEGEGPAHADAATWVLRVPNELCDNLRNDLAALLGDYPTVTLTEK